MNARQEVFRRLAGPLISEDRANELIDAFAHSLAERQRDLLRIEGYELDCICGLCTACVVGLYIKLIDPEVKR